MPAVSVVIPAYREGEAIVLQLRQLVTQQQPEEVTVIDASEKADHMQVRHLLEKDCSDWPLAFVSAERAGRAPQMNQGAAHSKGEFLLFLHADTCLPAGGLAQVQELLEQGHPWGRFDVQFDNAGWPYRMIALMMNWRSRLSGIATGDQAMFMRREVFDKVGGFDDIPLMEDINMSGKLKKLARPVCLRTRVTTSARRWEQKGVLKTILLMWWLRLANWLGIAPEQLAAWYRK